MMNYTFYENEKMIKIADVKKNEYEIAYYDLLKDIRENPHRYLVRPALKYLMCFLDGYFNCSYLDAYFKEKPHGMCYPGIAFVWFLEKKYIPVCRISCNYYKMIDFYSTSEEEAFYEFFELFDEYLLYGEDVDWKTPSSQDNPQDDPQSQEIRNLDIDGMLYKTLQNVRHGVWLPAKSQRYLKHFVDGYMYCADALGLPILSYPKFETYVREKLDKTSPKSIYDIIELYHGFTEEQAFDSYFKLLSEFNTLPHN